MRLLVTLPHFWPYVHRGSERFAHDLASEMSRRGHEVAVVTTTPGGPSWRERRHGFRVEYHRAPAWATRGLGLSPREAFAVVAARAALRSDAQVFTSLYHSDAMALGRVARLRGRRYNLSFQGTPDRAGWEATRPRLHGFLLDALRRADLVTLYSENARRRLAEDYGIDGRVMMPGIHCDDFVRERRPAARRTVVCAAAVDDERKRIDLLVDAFALVAADEPDVALLLVGHGDPTDLERRRAALPPSVRDRVEHAPGPTSRLPDVFAGCTVGALTSEREAFGIVLLEYLAAGLPLVGTRDGAIPEVVTDDVGRLFEPGDVEACADALRGALRLAGEPGIAGRCSAHARRWDWSVRGDDFEAMYLELAS